MISAGIAIAGSPHRSLMRPMTARWQPWTTSNRQRAWRRGHVHRCTDVGKTPKNCHSMPLLGTPGVACMRPILLRNTFRKSRSDESTLGRSVQNPSGRAPQNCHFVTFFVYTISTERPGRCHVKRREMRLTTELETTDRKASGIWWVGATHHLPSEAPTWDRWVSVTLRIQPVSWPYVGHAFHDRLGLPGNVRRARFAGMAHEMSGCQRG